MTEDDLSSLARELVPPPNLERKVIHALVAKNLIRPGTQRMWWAGAAAALILLAAGFTLGRIWQPGSPKAQPTFVILLREQGNWRSATTPEEERSRVDEYRAWASQLRAQGRTVHGLELLPDSRALGDGTISNTGIAGFFTFTAATLDEAVTIARTCPHLRYGGQVEVREAAG